MRVAKAIFTVATLIVTSGCSMYQPTYKQEMGKYDEPVGERSDIFYKSNEEIHRDIERAIDRGQLTQAEAYTAHERLNVRGHLTEEEMQIIYRDRTVQQNEYQAKKQDLDVVKDVGWTVQSLAQSAAAAARAIQSIGHGGGW